MERVPVEGTWTEYSCNPGFRLVGSARSNCTKLGRWSTPKPICEREWGPQGVGGGRMGGLWGWRGVWGGGVGFSWGASRVGGFLFRFPLGVSGVGGSLGWGFRTLEGGPWGWGVPGVGFQAPMGVPGVGGVQVPAPMMERGGGPLCDSVSPPQCVALSQVSTSPCPPHVHLYPPAPSTPSWVWGRGGTPGPPSSALGRGHMPPPDPLIQPHSASWR